MGLGARLTWRVAVADVRARVLSWISGFSGGVFLATCLLALLPDFLRGIAGAFSAAGITVRLGPSPVAVPAPGWPLR